MSADGDRRVEGVVRAQLPSGLYQVEVEGARITAHIGAGVEKNFVRVLVGDRVVVELAPRDLTRGRIVQKV
jgi:translation initiation factor IF-1